MIVRKETRNKCGVYLIRNIVNGKVYIGAAIDINRRLLYHIKSLRVKNRKQENDHFINSWHKHGEDKFVYIILEECTRESLKNREYFWTLKYNSTVPKLGFNKRLDSPEGMITHSETIEKLRKAAKNRFSDQKERDKVSSYFTKFWKNNPDKKALMALNVKKTRQEKYKFFKLDEDENILKEYSSLEDIIKENPTYKWQNIYSVCNGYKKRIYGFKWRKELKNK